MCAGVRMKVIFTLYLVVVAAGLCLFFVVGLARL